MAFDYNPKDASGCLEKGEYDAELTSVEEKTAKSGKPMLAIVWTVPLGGKDHEIKDYIVNPSTLFKLKGIAKAWHMEREFEEGRFDLAEHVRRQVVLKLDVESSAGFGDRNSVVGYLESSGNIPPRHPDPTPPAKPVASEEPGELIPF